MRAKQKAFTIVEILVVKAIISIVAAITIVVYNGVNTRPITSKRETDPTNFYKATMLAHEGTGKTLGQITGRQIPKSGFSGCP